MFHCSRCGDGLPLFQVAASDVLKVRLCDKCKLELAAGNRVKSDKAILAHRWHYESTWGKKGPVDVDEMERLIITGRVLHGTLVWRQGLPAWIRAADSDLSSLFPPGSEPPPKTPAEQLASVGCANAIVWLVVFLLSWFIIHLTGLI